MAKPETRWVRCPICNDRDCRAEYDGEPGDGGWIITCTNLACPSNIIPGEEPDRSRPAATKVSLAGELYSETLVRPFSRHERIDARFNETTSKREMFAAMAMQGLLAHPENWTPPTAAALAIAYADALIIALEKKDETKN